MRKPLSLWIIIGLFLFLSVGAIFGGTQLIIDPSGKMLQMPLFFIQTPNSSFSDYFYPGIILFVCNGLLPLFVIYSLLFRPKFPILQKINPFKQFYWAWTLSGVVGVGILIWIFTEIYMTFYYPILQLPFVALGSIVILLTLMPSVRAYYLK